MCGIGGWFAKKGSDWRPSKDFIIDLIAGVASRGWDATGYGTLIDGDPDPLYVVKGPMGSYKFREEFKKEDHPIGRAGVIHTRAANVGSPENNANNHPLSYENDNGNSVIVVHNGTVGNLDEAYAKLGVKAHAEVDSALFAAAFGRLGPVEGLKFMEKESGGTGAVAALFEDGSLVLARDLSPMFIAQPAPGVWIWSSDFDTIKKVSFWDSEFGMQVPYAWGVPDQHAFLWDENGKLSYRSPWRMPSMTKPPTYLKSKNEGTAQQTHHTPSGSMTPMTEYQKHIGFPKPTTPSGTESKEEKKSSQTMRDRQAMDKGRQVFCNWDGCWKWSRWTIFREEGGGRHVPLCEGHTNKAEKKPHKIVLSDTHQMARKIAKMASVVLSGKM